MGKTPRFARPYHVVEKHPHERGEDDRAGQAEVPNGGNTPTSVGKTDPLVLRVLERRKHPHERGEDHVDGEITCTGDGNTPTSVGKTVLLVCVVSHYYFPFVAVVLAMC